MEITRDVFAALCALACCVLCEHRCSEFENNMFCRSDAGLLPLVTSTRRENTSLFLCNDRQLTRLSADRLRSRNITRLYLDDDRIERIDRGAFRRVRNTILLSITHNRLDAIDPLVFAPLVKLRSLDLSHNPIHAVASTFKNLKALRWLGLSHTDLTSFRFLAALVAVKPKTSQRLTVNGSDNYRLEKLDADTISAGLRLKSLILVNNTRMLCHCIGNDVWYSCVLTAADYVAKWPTFIRNCYNRSGSDGAYGTDPGRAGKNDANEWNDDDKSIAAYDYEIDVMKDAAAPPVTDDESTADVTDSRLVREDEVEAVAPWVALAAAATSVVVALVLSCAYYCRYRTEAARARRRTAGTTDESREGACHFSASDLSVYARRSAQPPPKYSSVGYEYTHYPDVELPTLRDHQMGLYDSPPSPRPFVVEAGLKVKVLATRPLPAPPTSGKTRTVPKNEKPEPAYAKLGDDEDDDEVRKNELLVTCDYTDMTKKTCPVTVTLST